MCCFHNHFLLFPDALFVVYKNIKEIFQIKKLIRNKKKKVMEPPSQIDIFDNTKNSNSNLTSMILTNDVHNNNNIHHLVSGNSFDRATSLSDDSGVPLTNSSISSGSSRVGLCKFEFEVIEIH